MTIFVGPRCPSTTEILSRSSVNRIQQDIITRMTESSETLNGSRRAKHRVRIEFQATANDRDQRLDLALAERLEDYSRSQATQWVRNGFVHVDGVCGKPSQRLVGYEAVVLDAPKPVSGRAQAQAIDFEIVFEDDDVIVVNKAAGMVMHPAAGNLDGTLQNALLHHDPNLERLPRAGIVHRLDKDTSGLLVVARSPRAHLSLVEQLRQRTMGRRYQAICWGQPPLAGTIDAPIGRHPRMRKKMAVIFGGKAAVTHFSREWSNETFSLLSLKLESGRTHQIRVHCADRGFPLIGDPLYGRGKEAMIEAQTEPLAGVLRAFKRQALHARHLTFVHPGRGDELEFTAEAPADFAQLLTTLMRSAP